MPSVIGKRTARTAVAALALVLAATGCSATDSPDPGDSGGGDGGTSAEIRTDRPSALADQQVGIEATGLPENSRVRIVAKAEDWLDQPWSSAGTYTTGDDGAVDLAEQAPLGGKPYPKADSTGLLGAMLPEKGTEGAETIGTGKAFSFHPEAPEEQRAYKVRLSVRSESGKELAHRELKRQWLAPGTGHRKLSESEDGLNGELYSPKRGGGDKAPVLLFGGSEGGNAGTYAAALLASHGHPTLALCYFQCGKGSERPDGIERIDLAYFERAAKLLGKQEGSDASKLAVVGNSRGSEVAQLLGQRKPELVRDVVVYAPSAVVNGPFRGQGAAWADGGKPIPTGPIPLDRVRGRVLAVGGGNDKMWDSDRATRAIRSRDQSGMVFPGAGHHVNWFPYGQPGQEGGRNGQIVSTAEADQQARAESWPKVLKLLDR
ncbi:acyl-CoA thioesterase/bile acid-CoA:amino acid N-acyltransferase family protein [Streptomyces xiaopingdaonensis]|uniref:acyl-CoA thioesterase/bile acid-CoA:amino acid N-acyltransferase family protein n=1 Tax=Streptomyces xiaopingdaonensis TaxID=1565415 RepID=UPI001ED90EA5|nr:acyl-CoA thioesterase/bile acid-CoA:amino acid N-acyltransferase family protein [Streptomyces xiaopingdaonensis]